MLSCSDGRSANHPPFARNGLFHRMINNARQPHNFRQRQ
nr:MAG TPA: hypothetical protein [Caudoviricetes sp.]